jgi:hypothetical protein
MWAYIYFNIKFIFWVRVYFNFKFIFYGNGPSHWLATGPSRVVPLHYTIKYDWGAVAIPRHCTSYILPSSQNISCITS